MYWHGKGDKIDKKWAWKAKSAREKSEKWSKMAFTPLLVLTSKRKKTARLFGDLVYTAPTKYPQKLHGFSDFLKNHLDGSDSLHNGFMGGKWTNLDVFGDFLKFSLS